MTTPRSVPRPSRAGPTRGAPWRVVAPAVLTLGLLSGSPVGAQELSFARNVPGTLHQCPHVAAAPAALGEERAQAIELTSSSDQAVMLGDLSRAAALLDRAADLDPSSAELAYRRARVLEDLAQTPDAVAEYCRALSLAPDEDIRDARARLESLVGDEGATLPASALSAFETGVAAADRGSMSVALASFARAAAAAPTWPTAEYNRGVALVRLGRDRDAANALLRYLDLRPDAPDAITVMQRVRQLQSPVVRRGPSPAVTVALGALIPGMGQFYTGRPLGGLTVLAVAGGALTAGYLVKEVDVRCLSDVTSGQRCPDSQVVSRRTDRPYMTLAVGVAAASAVVGVIEAFFHARGRPDFSSNEARGPTLGGPTVAMRSGRVELSVLRVRFR